MEKGKSLSVGLLVELAEGRRQGLTHEENARLHGVAYSTSKYAQRWCEKMRRTAEAYLKTQSLRSIRTYRSELSLDVAESLSLQEGCASHGWTPGKYRMLEYACRSGLLERLERELSGRGPDEAEKEMAERRRKATTLTELERALEAARAENEYLRCENAYLKKRWSWRAVRCPLRGAGVGAVGEGGEGAPRGASAGAAAAGVGDEPQHVLPPGGVSAPQGGGPQGGRADSGGVLRQRRGVRLQGRRGKPKQGNHYQTVRKYIRRMAKLEKAISQQQGIAGRAGTCLLIYCQSSTLSVCQIIRYLTFSWKTVSLY